MAASVSQRSPRTQTGRSARAQAEVDARTREDRVVTLRLAGLTFQQIADREGLRGRQGAERAYSRALARIPARSAATAKADAIERALHMIAVWMPKAADGDLDADRRLLRWEDRLAQLQGTNAPARLQVSRGPIDEAIEELSARILDRAGAAPVPIEP